MTILKMILNLLKSSTVTSFLSLQFYKIIPHLWHNFSYFKYFNNFGNFNNFNVSHIRGKSYEDSRWWNLLKKKVQMLAKIIFVT